MKKINWFRAAQNSIVRRSLAGETRQSPPPLSLSHLHPPRNVLNKRGPTKKIYEPGSDGRDAICFRRLLLAVGNTRRVCGKNRAEERAYTLIKVSREAETVMKLFCAGAR